MTPNIQLDPFDRRIITELTLDARIPYVKLAKKLGVSNTFIHQRIKKLKDMEVLKNASFYLDPWKFGFQTSAYTQIMLENSNFHRNVESQLSEKFSSLASLRVARDIEDTVWPSNVQMPDYEVLDLSFTYNINGKSSAYLKVQNVADEKYETIKGYNTGGRQFFAGIRASF